jgi:hypothetical protein
MAGGHAFVVRSCDRRINLLFVSLHTWDLLLVSIHAIPTIPCFSMYPHSSGRKRVVAHDLREHLKRGLAVLQGA